MKGTINITAIMKLREVSCEKIVEGMILKFCLLSEDMPSEYRLKEVEMFNLKKITYNIKI